MVKCDIESIKISCHTLIFAEAILLHFMYVRFKGNGNYAQKLYSETKLGANDNKEKQRFERQ